MTNKPRVTRPGVVRASRPIDRYTPISNDFARSKLSPRAKVVALYLLSHAEGFVVTQARIAREIGLGVTTVADALTDLEAVGLLRRDPVRGEGGQVVGTAYVVSDTPLALESTDGDAEPLAPESLDTESLDRDSGGHKKNTSKKKIKRDEKTTPPGGDDASAAAPDPAEADPSDTPQTVVAAYVDSFRAAHGGTDPVRSVIAQVGREAKALLVQYPAEMVRDAATALGQTVYRSLERQVMMTVEAQRGGGPRPPALAGREAADRDRYWAEQQAAHPERFSQPLDERELEDWLAANGGKAF